MQIIINKTIVHYEQYGNANKHIIILHGWGQSLNVWRNTALFLSQKYSVTIIDFPGFGSSEEPTTAWDTYDYAEFIKKFLNKLNMNQCIIIGHSFGGRIATILGAESPERVAQIVLIDSGGIEIKSAFLKFKILFYKLFLKPLKKIIPFRIKKLLGSSDYTSTSGIMRQIFIKVVNQDLRYLFSKINIPVQVIWGNNDQVLPVTYTKIYKAQIQYATVRIVWGAGHNPHITHTQALLDLLSESLL